MLILGNVSETPTPTTCLKSTAIHLQFVPQYAPHLYRRAFLAFKLRRKGNPAIRLPFVLQYASHLYGSTPVHLYGSTFGEILGVPKGPFRTKNAIAMEIVVFCYRCSLLLSAPIRCHFSQEKQHPNCHCGSESLSRWRITTAVVIHHA